MSAGTRNARNLAGGEPADRTQRQCDLRRGGQRRWQHMKSSGKVSSPSMASPPPSAATADAATASSGRRRACSARRVGEAAGRDGDQPGLRIVGVPARRPGGGGERLLGRVLGEIEVAVPPHHGAEDLRRQRTQQALELVMAHVSGLRLQLDAGLDDGPHVGERCAPAGRGGAVGQLGGDPGRPVEARAVDDPIAGWDLLRLGVRTVGGHRHPALELDAPGAHGWRERTRLDEFAGLLQPLAEGLHERPQRGEVRRRPRRLLRAPLTAHGVVVELGRLGQDHVLRDDVLLCHGTQCAASAQYVGAGGRFRPWTPGTFLRLFGGRAPGGLMRHRTDSHTIGPTGDGRADGTMPLADPGQARLGSRSDR